MYLFTNKCIIFIIYSKKSIIDKYSILLVLKVKNMDYLLVGKEV